MIKTSQLYPEEEVIMFNLLNRLFAEHSIQFDGKKSNFGSQRAECDLTGIFLTGKLSQTLTKKSEKV